MARPWFRLYRGLVDNAKAQALKPDLFKAWINLLCCTHDDGSLPDISVLCFKLRKSEAVVLKWLSELSALGFIVDNKAHDWGEHQFQSDVSTDRVKRFRERSVQRSSNAERNAPDTDTDTDTESPKPPRGPVKKAYSDNFEKFWKAYPRDDNMSKKKAYESWLRKAKVLPPIDQMLRAVEGYKLFIARETKRMGKPYTVKHAQGWLTDERWAPYLEEGSLLGTVAVCPPDWADDIQPWAKFKRTVAPAQWRAFFSECRPDERSQSRLLAPTSFVRDQIESRFAGTLNSLFNGGFEVVVSEGRTRE